MDRHLLKAPRRIGAVAAATLLAGAAGVVGGACADLDQIDAGYCGNRVVEEGEDCDGSTSESPCGERDSQHACRFVWTDDPTVCPEGYVAIADQRCRKPSGVFQFDGAILSLTGSDPRVADIDGDGVLEVAVREVSDGISPARLDIYSVSNGATRFASFPGVVMSAIADLSGDGDADIAVGVQGDFSTQNVEGAGISVFRSPSLDLKFYARDSLDEDVRFIMLPSWLRSSFETAAFDLDEVAVVRKQGQGVSICFLDTPCEAPVAGLDPDIPVVADYDEAQAILSAPGGTHVLLAPRGLQDSVLPPELLSIGLAGGAHLVTGAKLADIDGDGLDDLVAIGSKANVDAIYVLAGSKALPSGGYLSWKATDQLEPWLALDFGLDAPRFETGHLNHDPIADLIVGSSILVSHGSAPEAPSGAPPSWHVAYEQQPQLTLWSVDGFALGDLNGDGLDDVIAQTNSFDAFIAPTVRGTFGGDQMPLVEVVLLDQSTMTRAAIADFDGDGSDDLLAALAPQGVDPSAPRSCDSEDELVAVYGRAGAFPEAATSIGALPAVVQIAAGRFTQPLDGFGDFAVAAACGAGSEHEVKNAVLVGNSDRLVNTPFTFNPDGQPGVLVPYFVGAGDVVTLDGRDEKGDDGALLPHDDLVVIGSEGALAYVLPSWGDAELDASLAIPLDIPTSALAGDLQVDASFHMVGLLATSLDDLDFVARFTAVAVPDEGDAQSFATLELPSLELDPNALGYAGTTARLLSGDLDGDGDTDYVAVYGFLDQPSFFGGKPEDAGSSAGGATRYGATAFAVMLQGEGGFSLLEIAALPEGDAAVGVAKLGGAVLLVSQQGLHRIDVASGTLVDVPLSGAWPAIASDAAVGDFNGDGLEDVLVLDGQSAYLLDQLPENP